MYIPFIIGEVLPTDQVESFAVPAVPRPRLVERMQPRFKVERYFASSGRTLRKGRLSLFVAKTIKPFFIRLLLRVLGLYRRGLANALCPGIRNVTLRVSDLPTALEGLTILHLSDFHIDQLPQLASAARPLLEGLRPDLCLLTGDYRYEIDGPCEGVYAPMQTILSSITARCGVYGILGNHDAGEIAVRLEAMGVRMLVNEAVSVSCHGGSLWLVGLDDPFDYHCADWKTATEEIPRNAFSIALVHTPELFEDAHKHGMSVYLCGHTHAGQIRLPYLGAIRQNADCPRAYVQGEWTYKDMHGYTSWGLGSSTVSVRFRCPPEIALLTLRRP